MQHYGTTALDASLLLLPLVGFLPADDPRIAATIDAIERELTVDGTFLLCSFWLVQALAMRGETARATALFERVLVLRNDVGLLSEEYDVGAGRMLGNSPQAFSHIVSSTPPAAWQQRPNATRDPTCDPGRSSPPRRSASRCSGPGR